MLYRCAFRTLGVDNPSTLIGRRHYALGNQLPHTGAVFRSSDVRMGPPTSLGPHLPSSTGATSSWPRGPSNDTTGCDHGIQPMVWCGVVYRGTHKAFANKALCLPTYLLGIISKQSARTSERIVCLNRKFANKVSHITLVPPSLPPFALSLPHPPFPSARHDPASKCPQLAIRSLHLLSLSLYSNVRSQTRFARPATSQRPRPTEYYPNSSSIPPSLK